MPTDQLITRTFNIRTDQDIGLVQLSGEYQLRLGRNMSVSELARRSIDAGFPTVRQQIIEEIVQAERLMRQRYDELARANPGKTREVTSLEKRDA